MHVNQATGEPRLPSRLLALTACRYEYAGETARLIGHRSLREGLGIWRDRLNEEGAYSYCFEDGWTSPGRFDALLIVDDTGARSELWLRHTPCVALPHRLSPQPSSDELRQSLIQLLGPWPADGRSCVRRNPCHRTD